MRHNRLFQIICSTSLLLSLYSTLVRADDSPPTSNTVYSMEDLRALVKSESWTELVKNIKDVPPAKRDAEWNAIAEKMAVALVSSESSAERRAGLTRDLIREFPHLKNSKPLAAAAPSNALADIEACFAQKYATETCYEDLQKIVIGDAKNKELPLAAAALVMRNMTHWAALYFYQKALDRGLGQKACTHERLAEAVISGLSLPAGADRAAAQKIAGGECWPQLKEKLTGQLGKESSEGYFWEAFCPTALKKKALTGLKQKSCQKRSGKSPS